MSEATDGPLLKISGLTALSSGRDGAVALLDGVDLEVEPGEVVGIVGESGSGKSLTCRAILRVLPDGVTVGAGSVCFEGRDLLSLSERSMERVRGRKIAMILQNPMTSLNPVMRIGEQLMEPIMLHDGLGRADARLQALQALASVQIRDPEHTFDAYPHQMSGGMRQRVSGAIAMSCKPRLLVADEPTTALDPTIQKDYLGLLLDLRSRFGVAILIVTHDLGVVAAVCDRVAVMYAGRVVESGTVTDVFDSPAHPYTRALLGVLRAPASRHGRTETIPGSPPPPGRRVGCAFEPRCASAASQCRTQQPPETCLSTTGRVRCFLHDGKGGRQ